MKENKFMFFKKNLSLNGTFLAVIALSSVLPLILSAFLLTSNYRHEKKLAESQNQNLKNEIHANLRQIIKDLRSNLTIASQNQDVIDVLLASDSIRPFIENRAYGRLSEVLDKAGTHADWALWSYNLKRNIFSSSSTKFPENVISENHEKSLFIFDDSIYVNVPISLDDQNLQGPNSTIKGRIIGQLELKNIKKTLPDLKKINSVSIENSAENFEIDINMKNTTTIYLITIFGSILGLLVISISLGLYLFRQNFILPLRNISNKLQRNLYQNNENEFIVLEKTIESYIENIKTKEIEKSEKEKLVAANMIASQVAHDIRSPLTALNMAIGTLDKLPEDKRILIRSAIQRINDIANDLLSKGKATQPPMSLQHADPQYAGSETASTVMLSSLIDILVSEKRTQYRDQIGIQIGADLSQSYGLFAKLPANELKRVLSNLVNNSVEAFDTDQGKVFIQIKQEGDWIKIDVTDNGKGIPSEIIEKLGLEIVSFGKEGTSSGTGLGIQHATKFVSALGGKIEFASSPQTSAGTKVSLYIPKCQPPIWFVHKIELSENSRVVALDDDQSIHSVWQGRLLSLKAREHNIKLTGFTSADIFKNWVLTQTNITHDILFLIDYELLGQKVIGLDIIEELNLQKNSILVSSRYDEKNVYERCKRLGIRIIPKAMAGLVPIEMSKQKAVFDAVLIDDDPLVHLTWNVSAKENQKSIATYKTEIEFFSHAQSLELSTPIVIDLNLSNGVKGEIVAQKVHDLGFKNVFIGTGLSSTDSTLPTFIKGVLGKAPDWNTLLKTKTTSS